MERDDDAPAGYGVGPRRLSPPPVEVLRRRLIGVIERLDRAEDLEFLELVATLPEMPFSEEVAVEILISAAEYVSEARARHEMAMDGDEPERKR